MLDHATRSALFGRVHARRLGCGLGALVGALLAPLACSVPSAFICASDEACGPDGQCEANGFCSFGDDACSSGRRYGAFAGDSVAGMCVGEAFGASGTQGDGDTGDGDTGDGDTGDGDGDGDGDTGDGDGDTGDGDGDGDGDEGLGLYTFRVSSPSWTRAPLVSVLNDPNAPNDVDLLAATKLTNFDRLMLLGVDGRLYIRKGSTFEAPVDLLDWGSSELSGMEVSAMSHVPEVFEEACEDIYFYGQVPNSPNKQVVYKYCKEGSVTFISKSDLQADQQFSQSTQAMRFAFADALPSTYPQDGWLETYRAIDEQLGRFDGAPIGAASASYPLAENLFWGAGPNGTPLPGEPDPTTVRAAYFSSSLIENSYLFVIAP